ncbi:MAG: hypothetical protein JRI57_06830 [Deltaproteobacteria bacterium]|nr:hypothetical protein [Deltaproteobacteria bacterium]MBW1952521.1 hypothetical protein [Deltaproteobacteria bacterium]MBW1987282.1 hypothetical protein [Deltaproteobacteria bacterium]MBW2135140.1 hypothetical protein [Deltaproteobacteria bacterium]
MSIRYLAQELYRAEQKVDQLKQALAALGSEPSPKRVQLEAELFQARKERDHYKTLLEAKKEPPPWRTGSHC